MAKAHTSWRVLPHGPLEKLSERLWWVEGNLPGIARLLVISDRAAFRAHLERLAALPGLRRIVVAHHLTIDRDPAATLRAVAATL